MSKKKLLKEDQQLLDAVESGEFESVITESRKKELQAVARNTFKKDKRIRLNMDSGQL
jgi:hypothetical protein